jgi:hypothetical protein
MAPIHENLGRAQPTRAAGNRAFGGVFAILFLAIGLWPLAAGGPLRVWALIIAAALLTVTWLAPALLAAPNRLWMRFGALLHRVVSPIVLALMFFAVVTPLGLVMRMLGKDVLRLRRDPSAATYWIRREPPGPEPSSMRRQF